MGVSEPADSMNGKNANVDADSDDDDCDDDSDSRRAPPEPKLVRGIYIRPMEVKDIPFVLAIQNFYIAHGYSPETAPKTGKQLHAELNRARRLKYPYLVAAEMGPGRGHANNPQQEHILGYAAMSDFCGLPHSGCRSSSRDSTVSNSIYRYNAQLDFAVAPASRHAGVGTCLLERSLMVVDDDFMPLHTCHFDCAPGDRGVYVAAQARPLLKVVVVVNYPSKGIEDYRSWARRWITRRYGFEEETCYRGLGVKNGKKLDTACLVRRVMPFAGARRKYGLEGLV
ncbi:hypothetical protein KEM55_006347 [Ascosphaera atra]|nr:hypothetical protein KEM55_006347 [Ascosphaera atra]